MNIQLGECMGAWVLLLASLAIFVTLFRARDD